MNEVPYVGFSNETLSRCPPLEVGEAILCPRCGEAHLVRAMVGEIRDHPGGRGTELLVYTCRGELYLAGVAGKNIMGVPTDASGKLETEEAL